MSNKMRWRYGDTNPVLLPVGSSSVIEIGDLVFISSGAALAAWELADTGTLAGNQEAFHDAFVGVAMQQSLSGETDPIRIATSGVFEFDLDSADTIVLGDFIGVDEEATGTELLAQEVIEVATANLAIGRCAKSITSETTVLVDIVSTVMKGGAQTMM